MDPVRGLNDLNRAERLNGLNVWEQTLPVFERSESNFELLNLEPPLGNFLRIALPPFSLPCFSFLTHGEEDRRSRRSNTDRKRHSPQSKGAGSSQANRAHARVPRKDKSQLASVSSFDFHNRQNA